MINTAHPYLIVTHAGSFHADEVAAIVLLERFFLDRPLVVAKNPEQSDLLSMIKGKRPDHAHIWLDNGVEDLRAPVMVVRSRDALVLKQAVEAEDVFVIDVGGVYGEDKLNFDHHQSSMTRSWPDGAPLSSAGLVWLWLKEKGFLSRLDGAVIEECEDKLIRPLDAHDNGLAQCPVAGTLAGYNRGSDDPVLQNEQFGKAMGLMREHLENILHGAELKLEAHRAISKAWDLAQKNNDTHVLLRNAVAYHDCTGLLKQISNGAADMIIISGQGNRFSVISQPQSAAFSMKCPVPNEWRGKMDFSVTIDGHPVSIKFAHKSGFMCVVEGPPKDAQRVARYVIAHNKLGAKPQAAPNAQSDQSSARQRSGDKHNLSTGGQQKARTHSDGGGRKDATHKPKERRSIPASNLPLPAVSYKKPRGIKP